MERSIGEILHMPDLRYIKVGVATLAAVIAVHTNRANAQPLVDQPVVPIAPETYAASGIGVLPEQSSVFVPGQAVQPLSDTGVTYEPAPPEPAPAGPDQTGIAQEQQLEAGIPLLIQNFMDRNAVLVRIGDEDCSGSLVRDSEGTPIGALTAAHCVDDQEAQLFNPLLRGGDGNLYLVSPDPVTVEWGIDTSNLQKVGDIAEFVIPPPGSNIDQAFAVFPGYTAREIIANYNRRKITTEQRKQLKPGTKIWDAGYPQFQTGDDAGNPIRHEFSETYIGQSLIQVNGEYQNVLSTVMKTDSNGATCSWGNSGGEGLVEETIHPSGGPPRQVVRSIGDASASAIFRVIRDQDGNIVYSQQDARYAAIWFHANHPGINMHNIDASCSFAFKPIKRGKRVFVYPVPSTDVIPGPITKIK